MIADSLPNADALRALVLSERAEKRLLVKKRDGPACAAAADRAALLQGHGHGAVEPLSVSVKMMQSDGEQSKKQRLLNALPEIL